MPRRSSTSPKAAAGRRGFTRKASKRLPSAEIGPVQCYAARCKGSGSTKMIRLISKTPKTTWDIGESWDRVNLQVTTHAGTFTSASPLQIAIPKALSELKKQVEYYRSEERRVGKECRS